MRFETARCPGPTSTASTAPLERLLEQHSIAGLDEEEKIRWSRAWYRCTPWPRRGAGLTRLKSRYVLSTLSNADVACLVDMAKHGGLPWDCILCAELFRHYKPDAEVYLGAMQLLGLEPAKVMMVAAHNYDLAAARSQGMVTAFVPRPQEYGERQNTDLDADDDWDLVVEDFEQLAAALGT
jgi:2-haloacid dehalogenase